MVHAFPATSQLRLYRIYISVVFIQYILTIVKLGWIVSAHDYVWLRINFAYSRLRRTHPDTRSYHEFCCAVLCIKCINGICLVLAGGYAAWTFEHCVLEYFHVAHVQPVHNTETSSRLASQITFVPFGKEKHKSERKNFFLPASYDALVAKATNQRPFRCSNENEKFRFLRFIVLFAQFRHCRYAFFFNENYKFSFRSTLACKTFRK